jgi:hypothetical protein
MNSNIHIGGDDDKQEIRDLTEVIRNIDLDDPSREMNATHMRDSQGRVIEFHE